MNAIRAQLSMYPKWLIAVFTVFTINLVLAMTGYVNISLLLLNLAMLFAACGIREFKYNKLYFGVCLFLSVSFVIIAMRTYPI
ncbi:hypothetical protein [Paenibacillus sp. QZ-Y1]|uniref:hypothetical protein n=1 Tax=Paenibacillus sp. QZ-Y1 TaxID=3414511 RepID=UPI003F797678